MQSKNKVVARKKNYRAIAQVKELHAVEPLQVTELDLAFNSFDSAAGLAPFLNLRTLILDHNNFTSCHSFPCLPELTTLSLSYNSVRDVDQLLAVIAKQVSTPICFFLTPSSVPEPSPC